MLNCSLEFIFGLNLCQNACFVNQSESMFNFIDLVSLCIINNFVDSSESFIKILLFGQTLSLQYLNLDILDRLISLMIHCHIVPILNRLSLIKSINGVIVTILSHKRLSKSNIHGYLQQLSRGQFFC